MRGVMASMCILLRSAGVIKTDKIMLGGDDE